MVSCIVGVFCVWLGWHIIEYKKPIKASDTLEHQPPVWPVPYACAQPYHPGSDSHGLSLVRPDQHNIAMRMRKFLTGPWDGVRLRHFLLLFVT